MNRHDFIVLGWIFHTLAVIFAVLLVIIEPRVWFVITPLFASYLLLVAAHKQKQNEKP